MEISSYLSLKSSLMRNEAFFVDKYLSVLWLTDIFHFGVVKILNSLMSCTMATTLIWNWFPMQKILAVYL
jgi:hypothetical protein